MKCIVCLLCTAALFLATSTHASFECFLEIPGIQGESTAEGHTNDITIESFAFELSHPLGGAAQRSEMVLTKILDKASPLLALKCADGTAFPDARIYCRETGPGRTEFYRITLVDVTIARVAVAASIADNRPRETVALRFSRIRWEYWPILSDGTQGALVRHGWDFAGNRPY